MHIIYLQTMEEEKDFVLDYDETEPAEDSGEESPFPSDTLVVSVRCKDEEDPVVAGCSQSCSDQVVDDPALAGSSRKVEVGSEVDDGQRKVVLEEGPAPTGFLDQQPRVFEGLDPGPSKANGSGECSECGIRTNHMKQHVVSSHIATRFWQIIPLMICWVCRRIETSCYQATFW